jgi:acetyl-CoA acetyltransferase family protein
MTRPVQAVIVDALRTPVGKYGGVLKDVRPDDMSGLVLKKIVERNNLDAKLINDVLWGCANQAGEDNRNVARMAVLLAGFPYSVPASTVNRLCGSSLEAINQAARAIWSGDCEIVIAGGVESMSRAPHVIPKNITGQALYGNLTAYDTALGWRFPNPAMEKMFPLESMGETAENVAEKWNVSRGDQDAFALRSHQRAAKAQEDCKFQDEIIAVEVPTNSKAQVIEKKDVEFSLQFQGKKEKKQTPMLKVIDGKTLKVIDADEGPRPDTSLDKLANLQAAFRKGGTVTAGNSSSLNDGAAALIIMSEAKAKALGFTPMARVVSTGVAGVDPRTMGIGPVPATQQALRNASLSVKELGLIELNEAFAAQSLAVIHDLGLDPEIVNVNGGAIALGHPLGCSGARIMTTLVHEMKRRKSRYGLATMCIGVGQGIATVVELLS